MGDGPVEKEGYRKNFRFFDGFFDDIKTAETLAINSIQTNIPIIFLRILSTSQFTYSPLINSI